MSEAEGRRLQPQFFARNACTVARDLIGCELIAGTSGGRIVETEAYDQSEPACHAYVGVTARTEVLFGPPGAAYVYLSYGIHRLFNAVVEPEGHGAAVLIRALEPTIGLGRIRERRAGRSERELCSGPGRLTVALGIGAEHNRRDLSQGALGLYAAPEAARAPKIVAGPRVGITKATDLPWRYCDTAAGRWLSAPAG